MDSPMQRAPIVALTANATKTDIEKCLSSGMNDYLPKPFTPDDLYRKIFKELKIKGQKNGATRKETGNKKAHYDFSYLRSVSNNDSEFLHEMIKTFVKSIPPVLEEMDRALTAKNWDKLSRLAHQIKPSFSLMGMAPLKDAIGYIEEMARQKSNPEKLSDTTIGFIQDCQDVIRSLTKEIQGA
jgi:CheY-like chemotaxis protein